MTATAGRDDPLSGRTLGDFVVRRRIGQGAFGAVYLADQVGLGRVAVVKVLHAALRADASGRFLQESRLLARLDHPYAAHVYAFGAEPDGLLWIAMERVDGTPLDKLLEVKGPFPLEGFLPFFERLCEVVGAAHERGIIHRDIKPSNVMVLCRAGRFTPKLLDLGVARLLHRPDEPADGGEAAGDLARTQVGTLIGTPLYLAPEAWEDAAGAGAAVDIYALGVLAYEALTGERPFAGGSLPAIRAAHQSGRIPPLGPRFPAELDPVLARAMARDPAARFPGALELATAFRRASGLADGGDALPRLDPSLAETFVASAPQPIAEAIALLAGARNAHQAREALRQVARVVTRWIGAVTLACRTQVQVGGADPPAVQSALRALRRGELPDDEWIALARDLTRAFASLREAYPVPELVDFFHGPDAAARDALAALLGEDPPAVPEAQAKGALEREIAGLAALLGGLAVVHEYPLVIGAGEAGEPWMGLRRRRRALVPLARPVERGQVALIDGDGLPVVTLSPLVQLAAPSPGADPELFFLTGGGRRGARLVALPGGFEHEDEEVWHWLRALLSDIDRDVRPVTSEEKSPYRGLAAFDAADADLFLGREAEVEAFVNRLRVAPILAVVGPSGAGKSSFVAAGVTPALAGSWRVVSLRPGPRPVAALESRLAAAGDTDDLVIAVDQFEELFTLGADAAEQQRFAEMLAALAPAADRPTRVILTVRDDFLMRCVELPALRPHLARGLVLLATPAPDDLRRILVEPAAFQGYELEADLADEMIGAVAGVPAALPLLSFTADRLWELRDRRFRRL
ncbi:MAG TPA: serine/threonine-protein kinase, partial [Kofleriaceae bacterium]|nr:serine/threonine-protein kinase [Kofleriaceae bacterium]